MLDLQIGDYVRIREYLRKTVHENDGALEGYITSINGPYYRIDGEKNGYQAPSLELVFDVRQLAIDVLGEDYFV